MKNDGNLRQAITKEDALENFGFLPPTTQEQILVAPELTEDERIQLRLSR